MTKDKYALYEESVQSPQDDAARFSLFYTDLRGGRANVLREDFCGTSMISCEWVKLKPENVAIGLDLDPEPLAYGRRHHVSLLKPDQRRRIELRQENVLSVTQPRADVIVAANFSFYVFKERELLVRYFRQTWKSMRSAGILVLEAAGGAGFTEKLREQRTIRERRTGKFTYVWDQKRFNPITHEGLYSIHFKFPNGSAMKDAFIYDWRVWTIPEIREAMKEAGFRDTCVYWEKGDKRGEGTGEYFRAEKGDNSYSWICYVIGLK